jgi:predicted HTH domain antitoxin
MELAISIPESVLSALRMPEDKIEPALRRELAVGLYEQDYLSFGKARELAQMDAYAFAMLLGERRIARHYGMEELEADLTYARGQ